MKLFRKIDNWFSATAFAEAGEFEAAREMAAEDADAGAGRTRAGDAKLNPPAIGRGQLAPKA